MGMDADRNRCNTTHRHGARGKGAAHGLNTQEGKADETRRLVPCEGTEVVGSERGSPAGARVRGLVCGAMRAGGDTISRCGALGA